MNVRLRMYQVLLFKFRRHLCNGSMVKLLCNLADISMASLPNDVHCRFHVLLNKLTNLFRDHNEMCWSISSVNIVQECYHYLYWAIITKGIMCLSQKWKFLVDHLPCQDSLQSYADRLSEICSRLLDSTRLSIIYWSTELIILLLHVTVDQLLTL